MYLNIRLDNQNWILEAVNNNTNLPKHLFYQRKANTNPPEIINPIVGKCSDIILCTQQNNEEILNQKQKIELETYKNKYFGSNRIISKIIFHIILSAISFVFTLISIIFSFHDNKYYKAYREYFIQIDKIYPTEILGLDSILTGYQKFWCEIGNLEYSILVSFLIFIFIFLVFEIFSLLIHKGTKQLDYQKGILYNFLLLLNMAFYIIFKIYFPLFIFLTIYSFYAFAEDPNEYSTQYGIKDSKNDDIFNKNWNDNKLILYVNIILKFFICCLIANLIKIKYTIIDYINKNYEDKEDEDEALKEKLEVNTSLTINNNNYNTKIKLNHILYLQQIGSLEKENIYRFKKVNIENITNKFVFVRLGLNSVTDQISLAEWNYPDLNYIFSILAEM